MNTQLQKQFDKLEAQRANLLGLIASLSSEQLNAHPEGKWSIAEIISHLITSEQLSVKYLHKKMLGIHETPNTGIAEEFKMLALVVSQRLPLKFKAPKILLDDTITYPTTDQLTAEWDKIRGEIKELLPRFQDDQLKRKVYKHPIAGKINIQQALQFFWEHINHHTPQVKNLLQPK